MGPRQTYNLTRNGSSQTVKNCEACSAEDLLRINTKPVSKNKAGHLYLYAIIRDDLKMPPGKLSAQAGHAYTDTLMQALDENPELVTRYRNSLTGGSKVTLKAKNKNHLARAYNEARESNIPVTIVVDQEHILLPHFDGSPIITAIGIGPCTNDQAKKITKRFSCV